MIPSLTPEDATRLIHATGFVYIHINAVGPKIDTVIGGNEVIMYPVYVNSQSDVTSEYVKKRYPEMSQYNNMLVISRPNYGFLRFTS